MVATGSADLGFGSDHAGFGLGVFHIRKPIAGAVHHMGGPVVDPLPLLLVAADEHVVRLLGSRTVTKAGLDRVVVRVVE